MQTPCSVKVILFDFGGVLAEEGFKNGLRSIGSQNGLYPDHVIAKGAELVYATGYVLGRADEGAFWDALRSETRIGWDDAMLRKEILSHFKLRPRMFENVRRLREAGVGVSILSDQTNWLDELNARDHFFQEFDHVFNSFHLGKGKKDPSLFDDVVKRLEVPPCEILFTDDTPGHVERARTRGLEAIHFTGEEAFLRELGRFCPFLAV